MGPNGRAVQRARIHLETPNGRAPNREVSPAASSATSFYCVIKLLFGDTGIETTNRGVYAVTSAPQAALTAGGGAGSLLLQNDYRGAYGNSIVEIDDVLVDEADATTGDELDPIRGTTGRWI